MVEVPKITPPVGRTRRVTRLVLIALGALLLARVGWPGVSSGRWFGHAEWVRFSGWLWLGVVFALTGYWLVYRSRVARRAVAFAVLDDQEARRWLRKAAAKGNTQAIEALRRLGEPLPVQPSDPPLESKPKTK